MQSDSLAVMQSAGQYEVLTFFDHRSFSEGSRLLTFRKIITLDSPNSYYHEKVLCFYNYDDFYAHMFTERPDKKIFTGC